MLEDPRLQAATDRLGRDLVKQVVVAAQARARAGEVAPDEVADAAVAALPPSASSARPVLNATGVVLHTNLGRAPLSPAAVEAVLASAAYADVEYDLQTGRRAPRGRGALAALADAVPAAESVLAVNNGAAALVLATTALAAGRDVVISRGEMVEIGDGFRLPELIASTGARLREVGTTNRTVAADYAAALGPETGCILKVHPSNFRVEGFTSATSVAELARLGVPVVADIGSGLLAPDPLLPDEPDADTALRAGADVVTASGDKLLGGPQAGLLLGRAAVVERLRRHPLARALRVDKLTLAALEATLRGPLTPTWSALRADPDELHAAGADSGRTADRGGHGGRGRPVRRRGRRWRRAGTDPARLGGRRPRGVRDAAARRHPRRGRPGGARTLPAGPALRAGRGGRRRARRGAGRRGRHRPLVHVVATAGHVDHGKSTLVRALTGMEPDRFAEEQRRGMTIDLGYAWTTLTGPDGTAETLAFVDVPGHERFIATMLAGLGPAPAVMFVVAADEGWRRQSEEHLAAVHALGLTHGLLVVTRSDLADPAPAVAEARDRIADSSLGRVPAVAVSGRTGAGLPELRLALQDLTARLPPARQDGRVRLWVDRAFTIRGAGTVVTGTLGAGTLRVGDALQLGERTVRVRGLQSLGRDETAVGAVARVAVNLRGVEVADLGRGDALLTPGAWPTTAVGRRPAGAARRARSATCPPSWCCTSAPRRCRSGSGRSAATRPG